MNELQRSIDARVQAGMSRILRACCGVISAVDPIAGMVKVKVQPDGVETGWISDHSIAVGSIVTHSSPSEIGTQVMLTPLDDTGDDYSITGRIMDVQCPPVKTMATGKVAQPGQWCLNIGGAVELFMDGTQLWIHAPTAKIKGNLEVDGDINCTGTTTSQVDVIGGGKSLKNHVHSGVKAGSDDTGAPV